MRRDTGGREGGGLIKGSSKRSPAAAAAAAAVDAVFRLYPPPPNTRRKSWDLRDWCWTGQWKKKKTVAATAAAYSKDEFLTETKEVVVADKNWAPTATAVSPNHPLRLVSHNHWRPLVMQGERDR
jgi:hypothetical protein